MKKGSNPGPPKGLKRPPPPPAPPAKRILSEDIISPNHPSHSRQERGDIYKILKLRMDSVLVEGSMVGDELKQDIVKAVESLIFQDIPMEFDIKVRHAKDSRLMGVSISVKNG